MSWGYTGAHISSPREQKETLAFDYAGDVYEYVPDERVETEEKKIDVLKKIVYNIADGNIKNAELRFLLFTVIGCMCIQFFSTVLYIRS